MVAKKKRDRILGELKISAPQCVALVDLIDSILACEGGYKDTLNTLLDQWGAGGSDCAYMTHRLADALYHHAVESRENSQAKRCVSIEAVALAEVLDALTSPLNRHGSRERYLCDDHTLNSHPEWLIRHHHESGGAASVRNIFESLYL